VKNKISTTNLLLNSSCNKEKYVHHHVASSA